MKGHSGGGGGRKGGSSGAKNSSDVSSNANSPTARNTDNTSTAVADDGSTNPSITSGDMAEMSGFVPTSAVAATTTTTGGTNTAEHTSSIPGAYAVPGINSNSTTTSSSAPTTTGAEGDSRATATGSEQLRRLSSHTRLQVLSTLLSGGAAAGGNGSNSALISSLVDGTDVVVAEATLIPDADAVRASQASPDIPIGGHVLNDGRDDDDGDEYEDDEEVGNNDESGHDSGSGTDVAPENNRRSYISGITSTGEEETHATGAGSVPTMVTAVTAESMQGKHVLSKRGIFFLAAGMLVLLGIALGIAIPLSRRKSGGGGSTDAEEEVDLNEILTYAPEAICYSHIPLMTDLSRVCTDPSTLPKGGPFCQLVTDGVLARLHAIHLEQQTIAANGGGASNELPPMPKVDMVITNAGAQRGDILPESNITLGTIRQNLPFLSNRVTLLQVSPFDIHRTLEGGLNYTLQTIPIKVSFSAGYPYASNLRFDIDLTQPYGQRVSNMELWRETDVETMVVNADNDVGDGGSWVLLDPTDTTTKYVAATNSYLGGGGDQYFPNIPEEAKTVYSDLGFTDMFAEYCRSVDILLGPDLDEMSTQNFVPLDEY